MTEKEQLWYLIDGLVNGHYEIMTFCDEFTRIYNLETDYEELSEEEDKEFLDLCEMAERYTPEIECKIEKGFYSEIEIKRKALFVKEKIKR